MKNSRKILAGILLLMSFLVAACDSDGEKFVGKWAAVEMKSQGLTIDIDEIKDMGLNIELEIKKDGLATFEFQGEKKKEIKKWMPEGDKIKFLSEPKEKITGKLKDGKLILKIKDVGSVIIFKKN